MNIRKVPREALYDDVILSFLHLFCLVDQKFEGYHVNRTTNLMFCTTSETEGEVARVKLN